MSRPSSPLLLRLDRLDPASGLSAFFPNRPLVPLLRFAPLPTCGPKILEAIGSLDENSARLLPNFQRRFPRIYQAVESIGRGFPNGEERSLFFFLAVCSIALEVEEAELRQAAGVASPLQVDYTLIQEKEQWFVDTRTTLRSLWSYKLADVPNPILLFSLFASLGQVLGEVAGRCGALLQTGTLTLSGDLAPHPLLRAGLRRGLPRGFEIEEEAASAAPAAGALNASGPPNGGPGPSSLPAVSGAGEREPGQAAG